MKLLRGKPLGRSNTCFYPCACLSECLPPVLIPSQARPKWFSDAVKPIPCCGPPSCSEILRGFYVGRGDLGCAQAPPGGPWGVSRLRACGPISRGWASATSSRTEPRDACPLPAARTPRTRGTEPCGRRRDQDARRFSPVPTRRSARGGRLRSGALRQDCCDALGEIVGHRLSVLPHRARSVDLRALRAKS